MSYYNQPDHELLDRRDSDARTFLLRLARATITGLEVQVLQRGPRADAGASADDLVLRWLGLASARDLPAPDCEPLLLDGREVQLVWRAHYVIALLEPPDGTLSAQLENKGFEVVVLGTDEAGWATTIGALANLFGKAM